MKLTRYFFFQFLPPFVFGLILFLFVLLFDKLFDLVDLIFNKGVGLFTVLKIFLLFIPTVLPLTIPMAIILASLVTFGRISEENELTAVRAAGISILKVLWLPPFFALMMSCLMIPFNFQVAPWCNQAFLKTYEELVQADPLINVKAHKFFSIKNIRIFADKIDSKTKEMRDVFVYQLAEDGRPADRIFAHTGVLEANSTEFHLALHNGQMQRYDLSKPQTQIHAAFAHYDVTIPLKMDNDFKATRFRSIATKELKEKISELKKQGFVTHEMEAELSLRHAMAFASFCLAIVGIPLATTLKRGGRSFGFGITIVVIFVYYLLLIFGLTLAEKGFLPAPLALWIGNFICLTLGAVFIRRMMRN